MVEEESPKILNPVDFVSGYNVLRVKSVLHLGSVFLLKRIRIWLNAQSAVAVEIGRETTI